MNEFEMMWEHLAGHRRLTVRAIEAFPEDQLFTFQPVDAMRTFDQIAGEILQIEHITITGIATGHWTHWDDQSPYLKTNSKSQLLEHFRALHTQSKNLWPTITAARLSEVEPDIWTNQPSSMRSRLEYMLENEIHHRGQGYVYLRMLGVEPPAFYER
jgi:uncharacterized damage-inducible protein DinB